MEIVRTAGGREVARELEFYNLDAIIAVGYRVNSHQATQFRIWATKTLREFVIKGFVLDDERLKQGKQVFGKDYFDELHSPRQGQGQRAGGETESRRRIRSLPQAARRGIHLGLRSGDQTHRVHSRGGAEHAEEKDIKEGGNY